MKSFFPELVMKNVTLGLAVVAGIYTAFGGLKAVVYTDAIQAIILMFGCSVLTYMLYQRLDFSWANVLATVPEGHFSVVRPLSDKTLPCTSCSVYWVRVMYVRRVGALCWRAS